MELVAVQPAIAEAKMLLERARNAGTPIYHVMHSAGAGTPYDVDAPIGQIVSDVAPRDGEPVIVKRYPNAFVGTDLEAQLKGRGIENVILAGFMTHMCIDSTARGAFNLGFKPTVVDAATATRDLPNADGGVIRAADLHAASLAALRDLFAVVVKRGDNVPA
jgi:nicotinamidase-related amidase